MKTPMPERSIPTQWFLDEERSSKMSSTVNHARHVEETNKHQFGDSQSNKIKDYPAAKRAKSGQFYLDCQKCGRTIFDDGSGSASQSLCDGRSRATNRIGA